MPLKPQQLTNIGGRLLKKSNLPMKIILAFTLTACTVATITSSLAQTVQKDVPKLKEVIDIDELPSELDSIIRDANKGAPDAQFKAGYAYLTGAHGAKIDEASALSWLIKSANQGNADAQYNLGFCYQNAKGVKKNLNASAELYKKAAEQGHAFAQNSLGVCYLQGTGVKQDDKEAMKWFLKAASQGDAFAEANLGDCYAFGMGVGKDTVAAFSWYLKAAQHGNSQGQVNVGIYLKNGTGTIKNITEALGWFKKSAEQNNPYAQFELGSIYWDGMQVDQDYAVDFMWFTKAAIQGHAAGQGMVGFCYETGYGVKNNPASAASWYLKSAEQGNPWSQFRYGTCCLNGFGADVNPTTARTWVEKAAKQGHTDAEATLAGFLIDENNYLQAEQYAQKSSDKGSMLGQFALGHCYLASTDEQKRLNGRKLIEASAEQGFAAAQSLAGELSLRGICGKKDAIAGVNWFRKAAEQGDAQGQFNLAGSYLSGEGVIKDEIEAYALLNLSGVTNSKARDVIKLLESQLSTEARIVSQQRAKQIQKEIESKKSSAEGSIESMQQLLKEAERMRARRGA